MSANHKNVVLYLTRLHGEAVSGGKLAESTIFCV